MIWKIAWRNLWRNRTRSLISISAIALSYAMFLVSIGVATSMYEKMREAAARAAGGAVLVHADGYWASQASDLTIADGAATLARIEAAEGVDKAIPRVLVDGLLSTSSASAATRLQGIVPEREAAISDPAKYLVEGTFFAGEIDAPLVLGRGLADDLGVGLGDRVVLTATDPQGEMQRALFHVEGVLESGSGELDDSMAYTTVDAAREALRMPGHLTQIGVTTAPGVDRVALAASLRDALGASTADSASIEVLTWDEAMPDLLAMIEADRAFSNIYGLLVFVVVVFAIMNTFLMIVLERVREFGLLGAIGMTPAQVARVLLAETIVLATVAVSIGFVVGFGLHFYIATYGIDLTELMEGAMDMGGAHITDPTLRSSVEPTRWIGATASVFGLVVLSALYPAIKASRLSPAHAMRFYQ